MTIADLAKKPHDVAAMFDAVARHYDFTDSVLTLGLDKMWRAATSDLLNAQPGQRVLDLAAGTGTSSAALVKRGADVVACDFSSGMLSVGKRRQAGQRISFVAGDAAALPFADHSFDAVTISFGLRNVQDYRGALREMLRVTKPGGRIVVCEFSHPVSPVFGAVYRFYLSTILPIVARVVATNPAAYTYLAESIWAWSDQDQLVRELALAGWGRPSYRNLMGGIVALHSAVSLGSNNETPVYRNTGLLDESPTNPTPGPREETKSDVAQPTSTH